MYLNLNPGRTELALLFGEDLLDDVAALALEYFGIVAADALAARRMKSELPFAASKPGFFEAHSEAEVSQLFAGFFDVGDLAIGHVA